jgi:hypothetical protein
MREKITLFIPSGRAGEVVRASTIWSIEQEDDVSTLQTREDSHLIDKQGRSVAYLLTSRKRRPIVQRHSPRSPLHLHQLLLR